MPSISTRKLKLLYGSTRCPVAMSGLLSCLRLGYFRSALEDADAHDDELSGICRSHSYLDVQSSKRLLRKWIERFIDAYVEGIFCFGSEQSSVTPNPGQKLRDRPLQFLPELKVVWFKHRESDTFFDRLFDEEEQAAHVDVLPVAIGSRCSSSPQHGPAAGLENPNHVDSLEIDLALINVGQI